MERMELDEGVEKERDWDVKVLMMERRLDTNIGPTAANRDKEKMRAVRH